MRKIGLALLLLAFLLPQDAMAQRVSQLPAAAQTAPSGGEVQSLGTLPAEPSDSAAAAPSEAPAAPPPSAPRFGPNAIVEGIAATVNEAMISTGDIRARMGLALLSAGLPNTPEVRQKLMPQVLRGLIDEQLQLQEGKKQDISVSPEEIRAAMTKIAQDNRIPGNDMGSFLASRGIPLSTFQAQVKAGLTWNKVVMREIRPRIDIGDDEIDAMIQRMRANAGKQEYLVSEIYLAVDKPEEERQIQAFAEKLVEQIKGGAVFGAVARQFSQGAGAATGGDIGWVQAGQLAPEVDKLLQTMQASEVAGPVRSASGYHILGVREKRTIALGNIKDMTVKLEQAFRAFSPETDRDSLLREAAMIRQNISDCTGLQQTLRSNYPLWRWQDLGEVKLATAPSWLAEKVGDVAEGHASEAMATDKGALILFVCGRTMPENVDRDAIRSSIGTERMELLARRLQRDLRRNAYIDVRLGL